MKTIQLLILLFLCFQASSQSTFIGEIRMGNRSVPDALILCPELKKTTYSNELGQFSIECPGEKITLIIDAPFAEKKTLQVECRFLKANEPWIIHLNTTDQELNEVVISGNLKEVDKLKTTVPVEIYSQKFLQKSSSPHILEAIQQINGIRPQLNCNICNTGDIHMNGLEGPYTMVLIDGMPIVSSLASVYGLAGIPISMIERVEVIRGPSAVLYGSEAIGGMINVITKDPAKAPRLYAEVYGNSWNEWNTDLGFSSRLGKMKGLTGINYFHYTNAVDNNEDNFTDLTLQKRFSIFHRISIPSKKGSATTIGARYVYEDRWGGEMNWNKDFRGGDSIYGESIYTNRFELIGKHKFGTKENFQLSTSYAFHDQNSFYGQTPFMATQHTVFGQFVWIKDINRHEFIAGAAYRYNHYDDNTFATADSSGNVNQPSLIQLPGIFLQDELKLTEKQKLLIGIRWDYSFIHGNIITPRIGYKYDVAKTHLLRANVGSGYRVVNVFTEDHAALTGARKVVFLENLDPERSLNLNLNYNGTFFLKNGNIFNIDLSPFYSYFFNKIFPDYTTDPNSIIYSNSDGYAENKGVGLNLEFKSPAWKIGAGATLMDVSNVVNGQRTRQLLSERITATWSLSYSFKKFPLEIDYTGNLYGPMELPLLGALDPRPQFSPTWSIQNIQFNYKGLKNFEIYLGIKNLLNFVPGKDLPFLIARSHDPFDKDVVFDQNGNPQVTANNPYALTFDPAYVYAPNQGIRMFAGIRFKLNRN